MTKRVIIVGGGYAGVRAMQHLSARPYIQVTLIDKNPFHYLQTEAYALIAQQATLVDVTVDLPALCESYAYAAFVKAEVTGIDFEAKKVVTETRDYYYDYIILAMGSRTFFPDTIPGLHDYAHGVKSLKNAFRFRQQFEQQLFARMNSEGDEECRRFNIVVAGAGLSGVEIAAELADYTGWFMQKNRMLCDSIDVHLIASRDEVLAGMHPYLQAKAKARLQKLGVNVIFGSRVAAVEPNEAVLDSGRRVAFDFMIYAGGIIAPRLVHTLDVERNKKGQIAVHRTLAIVGKEDAFAIGDVADIRAEDGRPLPATANGAEKSAALAVLNLLRCNRSEPMLERSIRLEGYMVALGRFNAAVVIFGRIKFSGFLGYVMKRLITDRYKFLLDSTAYKAFRHRPKG
ncbi:FAD-dependent oxidoreductase [Sulfurimonas sp. HSL1-6]|uniref:NAD(P)/FAD-dependent oxidoreductase n=1 Tax=Thiomicrolovo immobilis TaxID=3131935 RepID=UPI0031F85A23